MVKNTEKNIVSYVNRLIKLVGAPKTSTIDSWELAQMIKDLGFNLRLCVNVTDHVMKNGYSKIEGLFERIEHFNPDQVTFRKMWKGEVKCAESQWIEENCTKSDELLSQIQQHICTYGRKLEYGG